MTELARLDLARSRAARDGMTFRSASSVSEVPDLRNLARAREQTYPTFSSTASPLSLSPSVPGWTLVSAALCPVLLVGGWLVSGAVQPASYSPLQQTMSVLAGQPGTDRWIMTGALVLVGATQLVTAAGLTGVGPPARLLLLLTGLCTFGVASSPEPAAGPSHLHIAFAASCVFTTAIWPLFVARRAPAPSWSVSISGCAVVTAFFAALSAWLVFASLGGGDLGLAERTTSTALGLFPLIVALSLWQATRRSRPAARATAQGVRSASS
jgi:Protein of unknown function (DUF998)